MKKLIAVAIGPITGLSQAAPPSASPYEAREKDWRSGAVVYQIISDRVTQSRDLHAKRALDTRIVVANPSRETVRKRLLITNAHLMDDTPMVDVLGLVPQPVPSGIGPGFITVELPPNGVLVLQPRPKALGGYSSYKRVP